MKIRRYSELITLPTFKERFQYLKLSGSVGFSTFGSERYLNQSFYRSAEWKRIRDKVIVRDGGLDLGCDGHIIRSVIIVHHMNPISLEDIDSVSPYLLDPEYLICVDSITHKAIHYSDESLLPSDFVERKPFDTCPWKN